MDNVICFFDGFSMGLTFLVVYTDDVIGIFMSFSFSMGLFLFL